MKKGVSCAEATACWLQKLALAVVLCGAPTVTFAWSDHATLLWPLVRTLPALQQPTLRVEALETFVSAQAPGLETLLAQHEARVSVGLLAHAPRPNALVFQATSENLLDAFLAAIRVNPTLPYLTYRQRMPGERPPVEPLTWSDLSFLAVDPAHRATQYVSLAPGESVSPAQVIAAASDEPDFGLDIGLFQDSGTDFGARYGFGEQSFGNPELPYGSQAPFHMGFYHLDWLSKWAQPSLLRTYPAWRIALYEDLSRFAFAAGHDYWGWRFGGWALHYIGDLTQPYHSQPLPGVGTLEGLWAVAMGKTSELIQRVSNRHGVLESYQFLRVEAAIAAGDWDGPLLQSIAGSPAMAAASPFTEATVLKSLTLESVSAGAELDAALEAHMPPRYVADPGFEWTGSADEDFLIQRIEQELGREAIDALDVILLEQMDRFSRFAHAWIALLQSLNATRN